MKKNRKAILMIHGLASGISDVEYMARILELESNFDVYTFTLPGHDIKQKVKKEQWVEECVNEIEFLINNGYKSIYLVGYSLGGILACILAKYKEVKKVVLISPAFKIFALKEENLDILKTIKTAPKILKQYSKDTITTRIFKLPLSVIFEFLNFVIENQNAVKNLKVPTLIFYGTDDKMVRQDSIDYVYQNTLNKYKKVIYVKNATHDLLRENKNEEIVQSTKKFLKHKKSIYKLHDF